ncbi:MAG: hypothetical protein LBT09_06545 [Planctomycetaceae bacterium]|jgi:hypothetical protein|nr:hypothetical protein [Planctomycetaceae bacterium]
MYKKYSTNIRAGFFWTCQSIFWLAACLSVLNRYWFVVGVGDFFVSVLFGLFISFIFLLLHLLRPEVEFFVFVGRNWFAAMIIGTLLWVNAFLIFVLIIIVTEIIWWFLLRKIVARKFLSATNELPPQFIADKTTESNNTETEAETETETETDTDTGAEIDELPELIFSDGKTQQIIRSKTDSGGERLEGYFLVEFVCGQAAASVHVPFYPAFARLPEVEAYLIDAADAKLTVAKVQHFGARVEIKRTNKNADKLRLAVVVLEKD